MAEGMQQIEVYLDHIAALVTGVVVGRAAFAARP
jgi:hypothetical protein